MKFDAKIKYQEEYLPTRRHRILRIREIEEIVPVELRELKKADAPLAMVVTNYKSYLDADGKDQFGLVDTPVLAVGENLFTRKRDMSGALDKGPYSLEAFMKDAYDYQSRRFPWCSKTKEAALEVLQDFIGSNVLIDGELYEQVGEPRYLVNTFGLGHNHGGTAMFIENFYNPNISKNNYFNALQREEAIAYATTVATRRGDTESLGNFDDINIQVFMPELIRCDPQAEHGNGDPFLNELEDIAQASSSSFEAGLLTMAATSRHIAAGEKVSLSDQIQSTETCFMKAVDIDWDVDSEDERDSLPSEIEIPKGMVEEEDISDYLSDVTGFCHKGFRLVNCSKEAARDMGSEPAKPSLSDQIKSASTRAADPHASSVAPVKTPDPER